MSSLLQRSTFQCVLLLSLTILITGCKDEKPPGTTWGDLRLKAEELALGGEIDRAILVVGNAIEMAESDPATPATSATRPMGMVWLLDDLVGYLEKGGRDAESLPHRERALSFLIEVEGPDSSKLFPRHNELASRQMLVPDFVKSEEHYRRAIALAEANAGSDAPVLVDLLSRYADCLMTQKKDEEAEALLLRARGIAEAHPGTSLEEFPNALLAALHERQGRDGEAEESLLRQVNAAEQGSGDKPAVLEYGLGELARFYLEHDRASEAAPLYRRLVDLKQPRLGPEHPEIKELLAKIEEISATAISSADPVNPSTVSPASEPASPPKSPIDSSPLAPDSAEFPGDPVPAPGEPSPLPFEPSDSPSPPQRPGIVFPKN